MIRTLHKLNEDASATTSEYPEEKEEKEESEEWDRKLRILLFSFLASSFILLLSYFFPILGSLPVMSWIGLPGLTAFSWTITPSLSYVGQGMIMGPKTGLSMALGALFGWGLLGPIAKHQGINPRYI